LSGARATDACRHPEWFAPPLVSTSLSQSWREDSSAAMQDDEPPVFEDLFPIGTVPSELCPTHRLLNTQPATSGTPIVDARIQDRVKHAATEYAP
jgi:hypothetical protein